MVRNLSICQRRSEHQSRPVLPEELHLRKSARVCCVGWKKSIKENRRLRSWKDAAGRTKAGSAWGHSVTGVSNARRIK